MKCVYASAKMISYPCKISVERQYHVTGGGIDSMRGAILHILLCSARLLRAASSYELILRKKFGISVSLQMFLLSRENSERGRYHEIEECSDGAARSKLAYLALLYKIASGSVLIRADPEEEI